MEAITITLALLAFSGGSKPASAELVGTWRVQLPQEVRDTARKMGMPEPQAQFVFNADKTYAYSANTGGAAKSASGTYELQDHAIKLFCLNNDWPSGISGTLKDENSLDVDGLHYVKADSANSMVGTWTLSTASGEDRSVKMVFDKDGHFAFEGEFATSKGHYSVKGSSVTLDWTEIDGGLIEPGTVHKAYSLNPDGSLQIDNFRYQKTL